MRPQAITIFERLYLIAIVIAVIHIAVQWPALTVAASPAAVLGMQLFTIGITLLLVLLISHRRSKFARWLLVAAFLIGLPVLGDVLKAGVFGAGSWVLVAQMILQATALGLLFTPTARNWFEDRPNKEVAEPTA